MVGLALAANKQGRAMGWDGDALLLAQDHALGHYLNDAGFTLEQAQGTLNMPLAALPQPEHACGHEAHGHDHKHEHGHAEHVHGPDCKH
jgi:ABC-type Zn2+ transport system substrate-binding protein/surface adhesin